MQYVGLLRVLRHTIHFSLQLLSTNWALRVILQRLRVAQIVSHFLFKLGLCHYRIERRLGIGALLWPDAMTPVNVLDCSLIGHALCEAERSLESLCGRLAMQRSEFARCSRRCRSRDQTSNGCAKQDRD